MEMRINKAQRLQGQVRVPGDKSISHRAVMLGALCEGTTRVYGFLPGEDCLSTIRCFKQLGVRTETVGPSEITVQGVGLKGLKEPEMVLDAGNSGTTMRLMLGILAGQPFYSVVTGDASLRRRPMGRVVSPLRSMGAGIWGRQQGSLAPVTVMGPERLKAISYESPVSSAQVKSAVLLAGLFAEGETSVSEPSPSRDHTERMLKWLGADIIVSRQGHTVSLKGKPLLRGKDIMIPGDISSAAFFLIAGCLVPGSEIIINNVGINPTRDGIISVLSKMGANIQILNEKDQCGEPVADILVRSSVLNSVEISGGMLPKLIDEIPILAVAATQAKGTTVIRDAGELRFKETDRIKTISSELRRMGAKVVEQQDGLMIEGPVPLKGASCESHGDHRIAMAMAVAGLVAEGETVVSDSQCIDISFPGFRDKLNELMI